MMRALIALAAVAMLPPFPVHAQDEVLLEWSFDTPGDLEGWSPNGHLANVEVADGLLTGEVTDWDPFLTSPPFEIEPKPWQRIEVRMKCRVTGTAEFFWANGQPTQYDGFSPGKQTPFHVIREDGFHDYVIYPFWHSEEKIVRLRFDLVRDGGTFAVDWIRIIDGPPPPGAADPVWNFADREAAGRWTAWDMADTHWADGALVGRQAGATQGPNPLLLGPALDVPLEGRLWVSLRMKIIGGQFGVVRFALHDKNGLQTKRFRLRPGGGFHTYNIDMSDHGAWSGRLLALGLQPSDVPGATFEIADLRVSEEPTGAPDLQVTYLGPIDAIARAGKPTRVGCVLVNHGGGPATDVPVTLGSSKLHRLAPGETATKRVRIDFAVPTTVTWDIIGHHPDSSSPVSVEVSASEDGGWAAGVWPGHRRRTDEGVVRAFSGRRITFTEDPGLPPADYVPEPDPIETDYLVGTYYFPGWYAMSRWRCIHDVAPERKPVLGWYNESNPECVDWQIKWAVEHGISFFMVDWYWTAGARSLDHWLHNGYMKARHRKYLEFALMWANHNRPGTHSLEDWRNVTQYWLDNYFGLPEYLRINDKPAVFIWAPANIRRDLGGSDEAANLYALSQQMARDAGYQGITFVAMGSHGDDEQIAQLVAEGYSGATTYHWWGDATKLAKDPVFFAFGLVAQTSKAAWERHDEMIGDRLLYIPTVDTGWASQPWHGDDARVIYDRTPERFAKLCRDAKDFVDQRGRNIIALGPCNEWGEGSYIEPCAEYGFEMYDAIRSVFGRPGEWPPNVAPIDVGLGPYDFLQGHDKRAWEFETAGDGEGWAPMMGMGAFRVEGGAMHCVTSGSDPAFAGPVVNIPATRFPRILIRMKIDRLSMANESAQLFWETATSEVSEANSIRFELIGDNEYHDHVLEVGRSDRWRGAIRGLRLDPGGTDAANVAIDAIRLLEQ